MAQPLQIAALTGSARWPMTIFITVITCLGFITLAMGGAYREGAHGNAGYGVNRSASDAKLSAYAIGNCAHCHLMHASIDGVEPQPVTGPAPHVLFAPNFNTARTENLYLETDNLCFYCHSNIGQQVVNHDYSATFGGGSTATSSQSILAAFNQKSYHNLYDIWNFLRRSPDLKTSTNPAFAWFTDYSNPCSGCHNPHLARRNHDPLQPDFPLASAISRPDRHLERWGENEVMANYTSYEAPYAFDLNREPAGVGDADGMKTPDYAGFCTSCHNPNNIIWSTTFNREIRKINWGSIEVEGVRPNKHGTLSRDGDNFFREPYQAAATVKANLVLSCLDCHEPHGSENIMLLRRRVNAANLEGTIAGTNSMGYYDLGYLCRRCHQDDQTAAAGTGEPYRWEYVHHLAPGAPYEQSMCGHCHEGDGSGSVKPPISCHNCHGHGMNDDWAGARKSGRITF